MRTSTDETRAWPLWMAAIWIGISCVSSSPPDAGMNSTRTCRPTIPDPGVRPPRGVDPGPGLFGNEALWVALPLDGQVLPGPDGATRRKFMWWRLRPGQLSIEARRLDAPAQAITGDVPSGYGDTGFQASGVTFPAGGCWEITGHLGSETLSFIVDVVGPER
jgi:hypothetical protein